VVTKETVPVERVRLDKQEVTENVTVQEELRKEQGEVDDDTRRTEEL
ncbi:MAG: YsnF/AvaK domain-containing protein, partial [Actinomycetota bacterium]|nr:YsnF/AvaK domain-containing protein [Actinomycetota bacterium]